MNYVLENDQIVPKEHVKTDFLDRAYVFGDGVYEVIGVYNGVPFKLDRHLARLQDSADQIQLTLPYNIGVLKEKLLQLQEKNHLVTGFIYLQISRGVAPRTHHFPKPEVLPKLIAHVTETTRLPEDFYTNGVKTMLVEDVRWLRCNIKSLNLLPNILAKETAVKNNCFEAILHRGETITEGSSSNVFVVKDNKLYTHPAKDFILNGITRSTVLEICKKNDMEVVETTFNKEFLLNADEAFLTVTFLGIIPIRQVDEKTIEIGGITKKIQSELEKLTHKSGVGSKGVIQMKVIVIGTGIVGASAAYHMVKNNLEVIMIDKKQEGKATTAGAGIVCPWIRDIESETWYHLARKAYASYPDLISALQKDGEDEVGYKKVGAMRVSTDPGKMDEVEKRLKNNREHTPEIGDILRLNGAQAREVFPALNENLEAVYVSGGARVDGALLRDALIRAAVRNGAEFVEGEAELIYENRKVIGVTVGKETIFADKVLITSGAWAPELLEPFGIHLNVNPQRGQIAHIRLHEQDTSNWPIIIPESGHYLVPFDDGRIVAGATRETGSDFDYRLTAGGVNEVLTEALTVAPGLEDGTLEEVRIGFRPMGPDLLPIVGAVDTLEGVVLATGLGKSGLTFGPYVGLLAAAMIQDEEIELDLTPYRTSRAIELKKNVQEI
ncbi:D-amino-acid transaminase [Neobacillus sp. SAB-20_R2A]|uniref:D-amino-acid transaminase n=1 Tax=Neobacillus sp. SAB-20_R2A TaxID=3120519 RepID=UPI003C6E51EB